MFMGMDNAGGVKDEGFAASDKALTQPIIVRFLARNGCSKRSERILRQNVSG
jgi:hypothetical protein